MNEHDSLLLVLQSLMIKNNAGEYLFEKQACNGLSCWADNFDSVTVACATRLQSETDDKICEYLPISQCNNSQRIRFVELPVCWTMVSFLSQYKPVRNKICKLINEHRYLHFAIGGLIGDWPSVAGLEAHRIGRPFSVWTDRVEHKVVRSTHLRKSGSRRLLCWLRTQVESPLMATLEYRIIRQAKLGLFHGADCFEAYASYASHPFLVHNIHLTTNDQISPTELNDKISVTSSAQQDPFELVYAGRVEPMKGPFDWIHSLAILSESNINFRATWMGYGSQYEEAKTLVNKLRLNDKVRFPGMIRDRNKLLKTLRAAHLFIFTHKTPESPAC